MDINFHYFAVRTFAEKAGFPPNIAQLMASYSQFVDDYDITMPFRVTNVPAYARHLTADFPVIGTLFYPVTTGFNSWFDMAMLLQESNQKNIVTPFHFIPVKPLNVKVVSRADLRVIPQRAGQQSVLWRLLEQARDDYKKAAAAKSDADIRIAAIRLGTICHTFADTFAHQNFSGLCGWENHCKLTKVTSNISDKDITKDYQPDIYFQLPSIGHTNANHAPDDSNVSYETAMRFTENDDYSWNYERSNTREFLDCALTIFNFLRSCLNQPPLVETDSDWQTIREGLRRGFLTPEKNPNLLARRWNRFFPEIQYKYSKDSLLREVLEVSETNAEEWGTDKNDLLSSVLDPNAKNIPPILLEVKSDDFYRYNVFAKEVRDAANGFKTELSAPPEFEESLNQLQR